MTLIWTKMNQGHYHRPLIPLLLSLILGIFAGIEYPGHPLWAAGAACIAGAFLIRCLALKKSASFSPLIFFFLIGYFSIQPWTAPRFCEDHVVRLIGPEKQHLLGTVEEVIKRGEKRTSFILGNIFIRKGDSEAPFPLVGKIRVSCWGKAPDFSAGDILFMPARIQPVKHFKNPGGFDYQRHLAFQGIWATAYTSEKDLVVEPHEASASFSHRIRSFRRSLSHFIDQKVISETKQEVSSILKALVLGDQREISTDLRDTFNRVGVSHILAISGLHIGIVAGGAFWIFVRVLSFFRICLWHAWTRKGAALLSILPVLIYGELSGWSPSTQRAVIMVGVFLAAFFVEKEYELFNTLAVAALGILILDPPALFSISFQLSFASVFWIIFGMGRTKHWWKRSAKADPEPLFLRIQRWILSSFMVTAFASLGTLPLVMMYFNQVSLISLVSNVVIIPLMGFIAVPAGLMAVFLYPIHLQTSAFLIQISSFAIELAIRMVNLFSRVPFGSMKTVTPSFLEVVLFYTAIWALFDLGKRQKTVHHFSIVGDKEKGVLPFVNRFIRRMFTSYRSQTALLVVSVLAIADIGYWMHYRLWHKDLRISIIDVGAGNAILVELPKGYNLLIDGGGFPDNEAFDVGASLVAPFLWRNKIVSIDTVALSHPDADHLNGLVYIAQNFGVRELWTNGEQEDSHAYRRLLEIVREKGIPMPAYERLERSSRIHGALIEIWYPPPEYQATKKTCRWRNSNNNSMVIRIQYGDYSFLFPGDIMAKAEKELIDMAGNAIRSTLMVAPHHGSNTSSTLDFLDAIKPQYIIVSAGDKGPHPEVFERYRRLGATVFPTHVYGAIRVFADNDSLKIVPTVNKAPYVFRSFGVSWTPYKSGTENPAYN